MLTASADSALLDSQSTGKKTCDLCASTSFQPIAELDRRKQPLQTDICLCCGLISHHRIPAAAELAAFYEHDYRQEYHGEVTPSERRVYRAWRNSQRIVGQLRDWIPPETSVLEIGAGIGCTVKGFQNAGYHASGIEPHRGFQHFARKRLGASVINASLGDLSARQSHDLILMVHVIEHLRSPSQSLHRVRDLLLDGGLLYLECPNVAAPFANRPKLFHYAHIHNFSIATLSLMVEKCGFEVVQVFGGEGHVNSQLLVRKVDVPNQLEIPAGLAQETLAAAFRFNTVTYHLRPSYLARRASQLVDYARESVLAKPFVLKLTSNSTTTSAFDRTTKPTSTVVGAARMS
jgi:2-polyprenyl-3-methyl-5-hydroxy-6-metoxy-1,4-benzoquinol methylase